MISAWQSRLILVIGPDGYKDFMRISIQTVVLYESRRCIKRRLDQQKLRPFQKKALLMMQLYSLLDEIEFLNADQKEQVLWKTVKNREQLDAVTAWKRCGIIDRDLSKAREALEPLFDSTKTQQQAVDTLVQNIFMTRKQTPSLRPMRADRASNRWEHAQNHTFLTLRLYFLGSQLDPHFPAPEGLPCNTTLPTDRPPKDKVWHYVFTTPSVESPHETAADSKETKAAEFSASNDESTATIETVAANEPIRADLADSLQADSSTAANDDGGEPLQKKPQSSASVDIVPTVAAAKDATTVTESTLDGQPLHSAESARLSLITVRDQMELLKRFEGVMSEEELNRRKRELFKLFPPTIPARAAAAATTTTAPSSQSQPLPPGHVADDDSRAAVLSEKKK